MNQTSKQFHSIVLLCVLCASAVNISSAGPLVPPVGPVAPTPGPEPRIPINSTTAPGDAGSTFRIGQRGSYYLTGDVQGEAGKSGIRIAATNVTLDLNGFSLIGVAGSGSGITADAAARQIVVRNGLVRDWAGTGVFLRSLSVVEDLFVWSSGLGGIGVGDQSRVERCQSLDNGNTGISANVDCVVSRCQAIGNGGIGIFVGTGSTVTDCTASRNSFGVFASNLHVAIERCLVVSNTMVGIGTVDSAAVTDCRVMLNGGDGIAVGFDCRVEGCLAASNTGDGIQCQSRCHIIGNTCTLNGNGGTGSGVRIATSSSDSVVDGNQVTSNDMGVEVDGMGNLIIRNTAAGNTTANYAIAADNRYGQVVDITASGTLGVFGNAAVSTAGSTNPWANFAY